MYPSITSPIKHFGSDTAILQDKNNNVWNLPIYVVREVSELICIRISNHTYCRETKIYRILETLINLNKKHTFLTKIFTGIKYCLYEFFFLKSVNLNSSSNIHFSKLSQTLMIQLRKNLNMIILHKVYN